MPNTHSFYQLIHSLEKPIILKRNCFLENNTGEKLGKLAFGKDSLDTTPKA